MDLFIKIMGYVLKAISIPTSIYGFYTICVKIRAWVKRKQSKAYVLMNKKQWAIITPRYDDNFQRKEDILAAIKIRDWCLSLGVECSIHDDHDPLPPDTDVFFICGPKANQMVARFYKGFKLDLRQVGNDYVIHDELRQIDIPSKMNETGVDKSDCAILSRRVDTNSNRSYIFCMGIHGHGTLGAAHMLTTGLANGLAKKALRNQNFESIVSVPYVDEYYSIANLEFLLPPR